MPVVRPLEYSDSTARIAVHNAGVFATGFLVGGESYLYDTPPPEITAQGLERFKREYAMLYGWQVEGVDYSAPYAVDPELGEGQRVFDLLG